MRFHGLFIGIDRYRSPAVSWLSCARRDAVALHALFADSFGDGTELLIDEEATRAAIEERIERLARCDPDDMVVVYFSGHGSETHELVNYDADVRDLAGSCIPLATLTEWFARIPARHLVCILDCCFSGGMGAKVLRVEAAPRALASTASLLDQLSGEGRLILTASSATEEAWEHKKLGHGLLTHYLLEALQGAEEVRQGDKLSVYRLLEYVSRRVADGAKQFGKPQHPAVRGTIDGELTWPVLPPGEKYRAAFPDRVRAPATRAIHSLETFGFPSSLLDAWAGAIPSLNELQLAAVNEFGVLDGEHLLVVAPTSSGKTMVGELAALKGALDRKRAFFLLPMRALVNDKYEHFTRVYGSFGLRVIRATGEIIDDIPALMRGQYDLCLMTYEKFAGMVLANEFLFNQVGTIVVDEVQMIADESRGANLEFLLTLLRLRRRQGVEPQVVALSAVIGDTGGLERWLGGRLLRRDERPVPLDEGILVASGAFRFLDPVGAEHVEACITRLWGKGTSQDWVIPLVRKLVDEGKQVIVFRETKGETVNVAAYLARELGLPPAERALAGLPSGDSSRASERLRETFRAGVAFHNADLDRDERRVVEEEFRAPDTALRVIVATTTLAMGVNTPASAVVIVGLQHPGNAPYSVAEYKNIVGRAGRLGYAERGESYLLALTPQDEYRAWNHYVRGSPEDLRSRFLGNETDPRSLVLRVIAAAGRSVAGGMSEEEVVGFLEESFGAFQQQLAAEGWRWDAAAIVGALADAERHRLVERTDDGGYILTPLGQLAGESGLEFESIVRLVEALESVPLDSMTDATLVTATQLTAELDSVPFPFNRSSTQKEPQTWIGELRGQNVPPVVLDALYRSVADQHTPTLRAKKAVACLLWMTGRPLAEVETTLVRFGGAPGGAAGPIRGVSSRTCDILPTVARVAELLHPGLGLAARQRRLLARLELGVPVSIADLAVLVGSRLGRGDYLRLVDAGLTTGDAIGSVDDETVLRCVNGDQSKLAALRRAVEVHLSAGSESAAGSPILPPPDG